ncbi:class I SAM-dependent methyltransferase [Actinomadura nitritigenes]|uniref:class I SAM-dependent methyltransferase n=1 Tax=Actinomadura nitritigenes TaxID=134602 RepID=UPI003D90F5C1
MERRLDDVMLERSPVVANCAMNRERTLRSYGRELGVDVLAEIDGGWLDLCCGAGRALAEAAVQRPDARITGVDLAGHFLPAASAVRLVTASVAEWTPEAPYGLITCVHGLHYVGDKLAVLARAASWLSADGLLVANFDAASVRLADGSSSRGPAGSASGGSGGRRVAAALRKAGFHYDGRRRRISVRGRREVRLPFRYLGADDQAGPNYTGQPAVDSFYEPVQ